MATMTTCRPVASDLTVVIPTLGRPLVEGCLQAIAAGDTWPGAVVVVDQGSSASVAAWIEHLRGRGLAARHLPSAERGIAAGTNRGIEAAETPFVAVTHDDCRPSAGWVRTMMATLRDAGEVVVTGRVEPQGEGEVPTFVTGSERVVYLRPMLDRDVLFPANMGVGRAVLDRIGPFDEDPLLGWAAEDNDWAYRALRSGIPIVYEPDLVVGHLAWRDSDEVEATYRRYAWGQGCFYGKWIRRGDGFMMRRAARDMVRAPWLVVRGLATWNRPLVRMGWTELSRLGPGIVAGILRGSN